jgi:hypothetical protein
MRQFFFNKELNLWQAFNDKKLLGNFKTVDEVWSALIKNKKED